MISDISKTIEWTIRVPIFHNRIIIRQLGIAIGIPFGLLIVFLIVVKAFYALLIIALLLLITYLFILLFWGGKYDVGFKINNSGIHNYTVEKQAKKNFITNTTTVILGLFTASPTVAGASVLAQLRQHVFIKWSNIRKVKFHPKSHTILIKGNIAENMALFCTPENYNEVVHHIQVRLKEKNVVLNK